MLILGIFGLVFDAATLLAFRAWGGTDEDDEAGIELVGTGEEHDFEDIEKTAEDMNMCSAFSHVAADTIRSVTSVSLGLLIMLRPDLNGAKKWDARYFNCYGDGAARVGPPGRGLVPRRARAGSGAAAGGDRMAKLTPRRSRNRRTAKNGVLCKQRRKMW